MSLEKGSRTTLSREEGYRFRVRFDLEGMGELIADEPAPLGEGRGPDPSRLLAAAIGSCLGASLLYCMGRARLPVEGLEATVDVLIGRSPEGRLRIRGMEARLSPAVQADVRARMGRCVEVFEQFCTVTESVRQGIPVTVRVEPVEVVPA